MERAVPSLKWKTTASAACIPGETGPLRTLWPLLFFLRPRESSAVCARGWADYLGVFSATRLLAVHPCSFGSCERPLPSDTAHILPLLGPAPPALEAVKRVTSWRGFIPLCVMPYETGVNVLGCNSKRQHFVTGRVSPRPPISARAVVKPTGNGRFPPTI